MLLIKFYNSFCSFHKLYILKIGMQLEHEEINWNSARAEPENREQFHNFTTPVKFHRAAKFLTLFLTFCLFFFVFFPNYPYVIVYCFCQFGNLYCLVVYNV